MSKESAMQGNSADQSPEFGVKCVSTNHAKLAEHAHNCHSFFDQESKKYGDVISCDDGDRPIACGKGCSSCCSIQVEIRPSEALLIAGFIQAAPEAKRQSLISRLDSAYSAVKGMSLNQRIVSRIPCPFLGNDGSCEVYLVRPLTCRAYVSTSPAQCAKDEESPEAGIEVVRSRTLHEACAHLMLQLSGYEAKEGVRDLSAEMIQSVNVLVRSAETTEAVAVGDINLSELVAKA